MTTSKRCSTAPKSTDNIQIIIQKEQFDFSTPHPTKKKKHQEVN
jgi:hypothetical protein